MRIGLHAGRSGGQRQKLRNQGAADKRHRDAAPSGRRASAWVGCHFGIDKQHRLGTVFAQIPRFVAQIRIRAGCRRWDLAVGNAAQHQGNLALDIDAVGSSQCDSGALMP